MQTLAEETYIVKSEEVMSSLGWLFERKSTVREGLGQ
jgi:hypothetical protein